MLKNVDENHDGLDCYILNDQPVCCGLCGARTDFDENKDGSQIHQCLNQDCHYKFIALKQ